MAPSEKDPQTTAKTASDKSPDDAQTVSDLPAGGKDDTSANDDAVKGGWTRPARPMQ